MVVGAAKELQHSHVASQDPDDLSVLLWLLIAPVLGLVGWSPLRVAVAAHWLGLGRSLLLIVLGEERIPFDANALPSSGKALAASSSMWSS